METLRSFDHQLFYLVNHYMANGVFDMVCPVLRSPSFLFIFYLLLTAYVYNRFPNQFVKIVLAAAITFLLTDQLSSSVIKHFFHRVRPCNDVTMHARLLLNYCGAGFSFVSSHAANSFGMAVFFFILERRKYVALTLITWASLVSFSQVYVGVHYPADVIGGAVLGVVIGIATACVSKNKFNLGN